VHLRSSCTCLVNAFSPPDFCADKISYCDSNSFGSVRVEPFVD
jgi:hypothetical protein